VISYFVTSTSLFFLKAINVKNILVRLVRTRVYVRFTTSTND
jgi:hypothetical protein